MKTIATIALAAGIALSPVIAQAAFQGPAAAPDSANSMTVSQVLSLKFDRDYVCMTGNIVNKVITDHEEYTFRDATGSMVVEIEDKVFAGQEVTPETRVRICGEVDTETFKPNEYFGQSVKERASRSVLIADQLVRPNNWDGTMEWFFGEYGTEKHFFLIQTFGGNWDDAYIEEEILAYYYTDQMVLMGMARRAGEALSELNAEREANGLGLLKEADGTVVEIPIF